MAAEFAATLSENSSCSAFRWLVASATDLSSATMPFCKTATSSFNLAIPSSAAEIAVSSLSIFPSSSFLESSEVSNCRSQYSFLASSSFCSCSRVATISSIIFRTLSIDIFLPWSANAMKSRSMLPWGQASRDARMRLNACFFEAPLICTKLGLWSVFLKRSSDSSSLRSLIVSAMATSSSDRIWLRASHSCVLEPHPASKSARNFWSSRSASSVSVRSFFMCTMLTARFPFRVIFASIALLSANTSFSLAVFNAS
mmetsp:Transcript_81865/g.162571  ORF Transcript_81865/g.162571 Transcript_81865/m.162571 type:complete len:256 (+) Transcript_81865:646-1413(+)